MKSVALTKKELSYLLIVGGIILCGLWVRWANLETRPMHHDESLHALNSKYFINDPITKFYKYDPMLHGPFLYNFVPEVFRLFGISKWSARAAACFLGSILLFIPLFFRKRLGDLGTIATLSFLAFSPTLVYWTRFLRHDIFFVFFFCVGLATSVFVKERYRSIPLLIAWAFMMTVKENHFMTMAIILGWLIYDFLLSKIYKISIKSHITAIKEHIITYWKYILIGLLVSVFIYIYFYSGGFRYMPGPIDGLYRKSLTYWVAAHKTDRLSGPFIFNSLVFSFYEFPLFIAILFSTFHHFIKRSPRYLYSFLIFLGILLLCTTLISYPLLWRGTLFSWMKLKLKMDVVFFFSMVYFSVATSLKHFKEGNKTLAFWSYFFWANFFSYSFIGEKVPWLTLYPFIFGFIYVVLYWKENHLSLSYKQKKYSCFFIFALLFFQIRICIMTNFAKAGAQTELFSQVHTTPEYERIALEIQQEMDYPASTEPVKVMLYEDEGWPLHWYLYGRPYYHYIKQKGVELFNHKYIYTKPFNPSLHNILSHHYDGRKVPLRWWWVPDYQTLSLKNYFQYLFWREPWNKPGTYFVKIYKKRKFKLTPPPMYK